MTDNQNIKIISYNINGILNPVKRSKILSKLKKEKAHIALLQETHLSSTEHEKLGRLGFSKVFYSSYKSGHRRGVATLISQRLPFEKTLEIIDKEGRYSLISGKIQGTEVSILNVYIPPGSNIAIYRKIFDLMSEATGILICGGDWNIRMNSRLDSSKMFTQTSTHKKIKILMSELGLIDLWRDVQNETTLIILTHTTCTRELITFSFIRGTAIEYSSVSMEILTYQIMPLFC